MQNELFCLLQGSIYAYYFLNILFILQNEDNSEYSIRIQNYALLYILHSFSKMHLEIHTLVYWYNVDFVQDNVNFTNSPLTEAEKQLRYSGPCCWSDIRAME